MTDLADFVALVGGDRGLGVVSTLRPDSTIQSSVVNVGVLPHPVTGEQVVAFVSQGRARRLGYLRARPRATGWPPCTPSSICWRPSACAGACGTA